MGLDVVIYTRTKKRWYELFAAGLKRHGVLVEFRASLDYRRCDLAVFWAHKQHHVIDGQRSAGADYLVMERGYFGDRFQMTSMGFNGLNGRAEFHSAGSPPDRWAKHGVRVAPWSEGGDYVLIMGQVPGDAALAGCPDFDRWVQQTADDAAAAYGLPVFFRGHPSSRVPYTHRVPHAKGELAEAFSRAAVVITWNSNSGVDAVLAGKPVVACDAGSMAHPVAGTRVGDLQRPDRTQWLNDLAYCQWTPAEIESGEAWAHLSQRYR